MKELITSLLFSLKFYKKQTQCQWSGILLWLEITILAIIRGVVSYRSSLESAGFCYLLKLQIFFVASGNINSHIY